MLRLRRGYLKTLKVQHFCRFYYRDQGSRPLNARHFQPGFLTSALVASAFFYGYSTCRIVYGEAPLSPPLTSSTGFPQVANAVEADGTLNVVVWGSNKSKVISPQTPNIDTIRTPSVANWLGNVALRDLALHQGHAACVDARGDVYQWGDGFFSHSDTHDESRGPSPTLRGKDIVSVQLTDSHVFALSASGKIHVLSAVASRVPNSSSAPWWGTALLLGRTSSTEPAEITPREKLAWGERFVSISAGNDHLLALTSAGRTFVHPITPNANSYGQLGICKFEIPDGTQRRVVELIPKSILDPYAKASPFPRPSSSPLDIPENSNVDAMGFSDQLFEHPALKGIKVSQIATGGRSSYVRTPSGKVLGWGANEYGQIGLGGNVTLDTITVPTEIVLWRTVPGRTRTKCLDISAGGDLTCFTVERIDQSGVGTVDFLVCGNGRWGGLGNNSFSNAQGSPVRAKNVSGLMEYCEQSQTPKAILPYAVSVSPSGHILLTLDTLTRSQSKERGRDLVVWGSNYEYELGNGKRGSLAVPTPLHSPDGERFMLRKTTAKQINDLSGKVWKGGVEVEQQAVGMATVLCIGKYADLDNNRMTLIDIVGNSNN